MKKPYDNPKYVFGTGPNKKISDAPENSTVVIERFANDLANAKVTIEGMTYHHWIIKDGNTWKLGRCHYKCKASEEPVAKKTPRKRAKKVAKPEPAPVAEPVEPVTEEPETQADVQEETITEESGE